MMKRKIKSIFTLEAINAMSFRYPVREAKQEVVGYFSTLEQAEKRLQAVVRKEQVYERNTPWEAQGMQHVGYLIYERPLNLPQSSALSYFSVRSYTPDGRFLDISATPDDAAEYEFLGRAAEQVRFHRGDIVEVMDCGHTELCIVELEPPTPERIKEMRERAKQSFPDDWETISRLDYSDDSYLVYSIGKGDTHSHPRCYKVFPPSKPVSKEMEQRLRDKLNEMDRLHYGESRIQR